MFHRLLVAASGLLLCLSLLAESSQPTARADVKDAYCNTVFQRECPCSNVPGMGCCPYASYSNGGNTCTTPSTLTCVNTKAGGGPLEEPCISLLHISGCPSVSCINGFQTDAQCPAFSIPTCVP